MPRGPKTIWEREAVVLLIREYAERYGYPPTVLDWNPYAARKRGRADLADRFERDRCWPHAGTVRNLFGSWPAALTEAGFRNQPRTFARAKLRWREAGLVTSADIAQMAGLTRTAIYRYLRRGDLEPVRMAGTIALYDLEAARVFAAELADSLPTSREHQAIAPPERLAD